MYNQPLAPEFRVFVLNRQWCCTGPDFAFATSVPTRPVMVGVRLADHRQSTRFTNMLLLAGLLRSLTSEMGHSVRRRPDFISAMSCSCNRSPTPVSPRQRVTEPHNNYKWTVWASPFFKTLIPFSLSSSHSRPLIISLFTLQP